MGTRSLIASLTLCISLLALSCLGQAYTYLDTAFMGVARPVAASPPASGVSPTNLPGYPALTWYKGDDWVTNNGETWPDRGANGWNLTQVATANITTATLDSQKMVRFSGNDYSLMTNDSYTNRQPCTWVMLCRIHTNDFPNKVMMFCNPGTEILKFLNLEFSNGYIDAEAGAFDLAGNIGWKTNVWYVWEVVWNGASSALYTNGIAAIATANAGANNGGKLWIAGSDNFGDKASIDVLEIATYNTNLSAGARASLYNYFKTNYPSASLP